MKRFLLIFLALTLPLGATVPKRTEMAPPRTVQQDLELRDWIVGIQTVAQEAEKRADAADQEAQIARAQSVIAGAKLTEVQNQLATIQRLYDALLDQVRVLQERLAKAMKLLGEFSWIIGICLAFVVLLLMLWLHVPAMSPPWGLVACCALPLLALSVIKILPHL